MPKTYFCFWYKEAHWVDKYIIPQPEAFSPGDRAVGDCVDLPLVGEGIPLGKPSRFQMRFDLNHGMKARTHHLCETHTISNSVVQVDLPQVVGSYYILCNLPEYKVLSCIFILMRKSWMTSFIFKAVLNGRWLLMKGSLTGVLLYSWHQDINTTRCFPLTDTDKLHIYTFINYRFIHLFIYCVTQNIIWSFTIVGNFY